MGLHTTHSITRVLGGCLVGGVVGFILAMLGQSMNSSPDAMLGTVCFGAFFGFLAAQLNGALVGAGLALVLIPVGQALGGSVLQVCGTVTAFAIAGGAVRWHLLQRQRRLDMLTGRPLLRTPRRQRAPLHRELAWR